MSVEWGSAENLTGSIFYCKVCGCIVGDRPIHEAWHKSINLIATDLYGVDTEID